MMKSVCTICYLLQVVVSSFLLSGCTFSHQTNHETVTFPISARKISVSPDSYHYPPSLAVDQTDVWVTSLWKDGLYLCRVNQQTSKMTGAVRVGQSQLSSVAVGAGAVWVSLEREGTLVRFNPTTNGIEAKIELGKESWPGAITVGEGTVWVITSGNGTLTGIDPLRNQVSISLPLPYGAAQSPARSLLGGPKSLGVPKSTHYAALALGHGSLWITGYKYLPLFQEWFTKNPGWLFRINPISGEVEATIPVGREPGYLAIDDSAIWVANQRDESLSRIDPNTNQTVSTIDLPNPPVGLAVGNNGVWVLIDQVFGGGFLVKIDPLTNKIGGKHIKFNKLEGNEKFNTSDLCRLPLNVVTSNGVFWVGNREYGTVWRIDVTQ